MALRKLVSQIMRKARLCVSIKTVETRTQPWGDAYSRDQYCWRRGANLKQKIKCNTCLLALRYRQSRVNKEKTQMLCIGSRILFIACQTTSVWPEKALVEMPGVSHYYAIRPVHYTNNFWVRERVGGRERGGGREWGRRRRLTGYVEKNTVM